MRLRHDTPLSDTKPERTVRRILELLKVSFVSQEPITVNDPTTGSAYTFTVDYLVNRKVAIAVHGSFKIKSSRSMDKIEWEKKLLKEAGYEVVDVWDSELAGFDKIYREVVRWKELTK